MTSPGPVLEARKLSKQFAGFYAVRDLDLQVYRNSIHALIGPNGAGKTTCFNLLTKFLPSSSGQILLHGEDITGEAPDAVARKGLSRSFQISAVFGQMTVRENIQVALQRKLGISHQFWRSGRALDELNPKVSELAQRFDLEGLLDAAAGRLSYGKRRALEITTTIASDPEILLLDEPMAGLGREDIEKTVALIRQAGTGRTVVMVEHNLSVLAELSDRVTVMARGQIIAEGSYAEVSSRKEVKEAYLGARHA